jgi:T5SS/PEP-CTERM-associated repeat protein
VSLAGTYSWTGAGGSSAFGLAGNWLYDGTKQVDGVPGANDEGSFVGATVCSGNGTLGSLNVDGTGAGAVFSASIAVDSFADFAGVSMIDAGKLSVGQELSLLGALTESGGAKVAASYLSIGGTTAAGSYAGTFTATGAGTTLSVSGGTADGSLDVGSRFRGVLDVAAAAQVTCTSLALGASSGTSVVGTGTASIIGGTVTIATPAADPGYVITAGSNLTVGAAGHLVAGSGVDGGVFTLSGAGAVAALSGTQTIDGAFTIAAGGTVNGTGQARVVIGEGKAGTLNVADGALSLSSGTAMLVGDGGAGALNISQGGTVRVDSGTAGAPEIVIGAVDVAPGVEQGTGQASVTGTGSILAVQGELDLTGASAAHLTISTGGTVQADTAVVGGSVNMVGNAALAVAGNLTVGGGVLTASGGSHLSAAENGGTGAVFLDGTAANGGATVSVTGAGSSLTALGGIVITGANAALTIGGAATASAITSTSGSEPISISNGGVLVVSGTASRLTASGGVTQIGAASLLQQTGPGSVLIIGGATLVSNAGTTAQQPGVGLAATIGDSTARGGRSVVTVDGAGSQWQINGNLTMGLNGPTGASASILKVISGATATVTGTLSADAAGNIILVAGAHGALTAGQIELLPGVSLDVAGGAQVEMDDGTIGAGTLTAGTLSASGTMAIYGGTMEGSGLVRAPSLVMLTASSWLEAQGSLSVLGAVTGAGVLAVSAGGTLALGGAGADSAALRFLGSDAVLDATALDKLDGTLSGFAAGDVIDVGGVVASEASYAPGTLTLEGSSGQILGLLRLSGTYAGGEFALMPDGHGGTVIGLG